MSNLFVGHRNKGKWESCAVLDKSSRYFGNVQVMVVGLWCAKLAVDDEYFFRTYFSHTNLLNKTKQHSFPHH